MIKLTIIIVVLVVLYVLEAFHDYYVIINQSPQGSETNNRKWHSFDFIFHILNACLLAYLYGNWIVLLIAGFIRWIFFQNTLNILRKKSLFYLGSGGIDLILRKVFGKYAGQILFILSFLSLSACILKAYHIF